MYRKWGKRAFDCFLSFCALIVLSPLFLLLSSLVFVFLGKPIIFKQVRPGLNNKLFFIYKFRTMTNAKDKNGRLLPDEQRLTKFGRFLRNSSLDELPEIWNIFIGDMALIGPRPLLVKDMVFFSPDIDKRSTIRPGLTGLAQASGRNRISWDKKFAYDIQYMETYGFCLDFCLFFKTIWSAFVKKEGIEETGFATSEDYGDYLYRLGKVSKEVYFSQCQRAESLVSSFRNERCRKSKRKPQ
jgi:undecaprenyl phosphate N,N'-diacetylbacillosamine 1-phosphate transferase